MKCGGGERIRLLRPRPFGNAGFSHLEPIANLGLVIPRPAIGLRRLPFARCRPLVAAFPSPLLGARFASNPLSKNLAEERGFEPLEACASTVFKTAAFSRSATPPLRRQLIVCEADFEPRAAG